MKQLIDLQEYQEAFFSRSELTEEDGLRLLNEYKGKIEVDFPSPKTEYRWKLVPQGWVGHIPLSADCSIMLHPKVPLRNLFGMWEYAYRLKSFKFLNDLYESQSLQEFYSQLAGVFARRVLDRGRKGYYRTYLPLSDELPYLRGNLDVRRLMQAPWETRLTCHYEEHTPDIEENQILVWTLFTIARSGLCHSSTVRTVRSAYRNLQGLVTLTSFRPADCVGRLYNRLNQDYHLLHALSRFFLEQSGPHFETGDRKMLPFLVDMAGLYELFVAEWLRAHLPPVYRLRAQEQVDISEEGKLSFKIDLVLYDLESGQALTVLDTKYKSASSPASDDVAQVIAYAQSKHCQEAALIYPMTMQYPLDSHVGDIRVRSLAFCLDDDLEENGQKFLQSLLKFSKRR